MRSRWERSPARPRWTRSPARGEATLCEVVVATLGVVACEGRGRLRGGAPVDGEEVASPVPLPLLEVRAEAAHLISPLPLPVPRGTSVTLGSGNRHYRYMDTYKHGPGQQACFRALAVYIVKQNKTV